MPLADPPTGRAFEVDLGQGEQPFAAVVFPDFAVAGGPQAPLLLRRAVTGSLDLYAWWDAARSDAARDDGRTVTVTLLTADFSVVVRWRFLGARVVSLAYTPLDANQAGLMFETLTLSFERMEMASG